jgi:hypothetical protein
MDSQITPLLVETFEKNMQTVKGSWIATCIIHYLPVAIQQPFIIFSSVSTTFLKFSKNQLNKQSTINQPTKETTMQKNN